MLKSFMIINAFQCDVNNLTLTYKQLATHGCVHSTLATDALVLKYQAISIHTADYIFIILDKFHAKVFCL